MAGQFVRFVLENARTAPTNSWTWVWWAAWRAPSMTATWPLAGACRARRCSRGKIGRLSPPRTWRTGIDTRPSATSAAPGDPPRPRALAARCAPQRRGEATLGPAGRARAQRPTSRRPRGRTGRGLVAVASLDQVRDPSLELGDAKPSPPSGAGAPRRRRAGRCCRSAAPRQAPWPPVRVADDVDGLPALLGERVGDRSQVLVLPLDRVGPRPVAGVPRPRRSIADAKGLLEHGDRRGATSCGPRLRRGPARAAGAARREHGDRRPVARGDAAEGVRHAGRLAAAASSRIQVAPARRASWAGQRRSSRSLAKDRGDDVGLGGAVGDDEDTGATSRIRGWSVTRRRGTRRGSARHVQDRLAARRTSPSPGTR